MKFEVFVYGENQRIETLKLSGDFLDYSFSGVVGGKLNGNFALFFFDENESGVLKKVEFVMIDEALKYALA